MSVLSERIKTLRQAAHLTQEELAAKLRVSKGAIGNWETAKREPDNATIEEIADIFNVDLDYLFGRTNTIPEFSLEEKWIVSCYRNADEDIKFAVKAVLRLFDDSSVKRKKIIPLFGSSFAAGAFEPGTQAEPFEDYEVDADTKAEFAIRVSGDSMEPELHDDQIVLCVKRHPNIGEIGVFFVNGSFYVKQFITDGRNIYLRSINRKRRDADLDIWASGNDTVRCFGTVIHKKIPLVDEWG